VSQADEERFAHDVDDDAKMEEDEKNDLDDEVAKEIERVRAHILQNSAIRSDSDHSVRS
jgi:Ni,Fe-hydrogenase III large subunit